MNVMNEESSLSITMKINESNIRTFIAPTTPKLNIIGINKLAPIMLHTIKPTLCK